MDNLIQHLPEDFDRLKNMSYFAYSARNSSDIPVIISMLSLDHGLKLEVVLKAWSQVYFTYYSKKPFDGNLQQYYRRLLEHPQRINLVNFLIRFKDTKDYQTPQVKKIAIHNIFKYLNLASHNPEFLHSMMDLIEDSLSSCADRISWTYNELSYLAMYHDEFFSKSGEIDIAKGLIGIERKRLLDLIALENATTCGLGDQIEVALYYHIKLKKALKLPGSCEDMLYPDISFITHLMLEKAREKIRLQTTSKESLRGILMQTRSGDSIFINSTQLIS